MPAASPRCWPKRVRRWQFDLAMPQTGTLRSWNDDRGFGFIAPRDGGRELFVHISAFPRDGSRPAVGETLTFEPGPGKEGKPQAIRVYRQALGRPAQYPRSRTHQAKRRGPTTATKLITVVLFAALAAYGYSAYDKYRRRALATSIAAETAIPDASTAPARAAAPMPTGSFRCDGRTHCSQMTSCAEAKFFLNNCPGTRMDGNNDGVPCEQQWCTGLFAK